MPWITYHTHTHHTPQTHHTHAQTTTMHTLTYRHTHTHTHHRQTLTYNQTHTHTYSHTHRHVLYTHTYMLTRTNALTHARNALTPTHALIHLPSKTCDLHSLHLLTRQHQPRESNAYWVIRPRDSRRDATPSQGPLMPGAPNVVPGTPPLNQPPRTTGLTPISGRGVGDEKQPSE